MANFGVKPRSPVINWGHPLARRLIIDIPLFENGGIIANELVCKTKESFVGAPVYGVGIMGPQRTFGGASDAITSVTTRTLTTKTDNFTMAVCFNTAASANGAEYVMMNLSNVNDNAGVSIEINDHNLSLLINGVARVSTGFAPVVGTIYTAFFRRLQGTSQMFLNGSTLSATSASNPNTNPSNINLGCARQNATTLFRYFNGTIYWGRFWERALTIPEMCNLTVNPWQIYQSSKLTLGKAPATTGPANVKTVNGLAKASVKTINGLAIASVKSWNGIT
jgi:hypothetical protein